MADAQKTLETIKQQKDALRHTEFICTNLEFMAMSAANMSREELNSNNKKLPKEGSTSQDTGHNHVFVVDASGNGVAKEACHPTFPNICHTHRIINWAVQSAESKSIDRDNGAPPHIHSLMSSTKPLPETTTGVSRGAAPAMSSPRQTTTPSGRSGY